LKKEDNNNRTSYRQVDTLRGHDLTVVQMAFSHDGEQLLSVSRDRTWKLFRKKANTVDSYELIRGLTPKNNHHTRIIWSCGWSHDDKYFLTTSRDKRICLWSGATEFQGKPEEPLGLFEFNESVTACSFAPILVANMSS
jgi:elongator complex protein 2